MIILLVIMVFLLVYIIIVGICMTLFYKVLTFHHEGGIKKVERECDEVALFAIFWIISVPIYIYKRMTERLKRRDK